jgi:predicted negative regulator of RcsB-dependent stress response
MSSEATSSSTALYDLLAWAEVNKKRLAVGAAVVAALAAAIGLYAYNRAEGETAAAKALSEVVYAQTGQRGATPSAAEYLKVASNHPGTRAAERALILGAGAMFAEGKYAEAQAQFERFLKQSPESALAPVASLGVASCLDALSKPEEAMTAYQKVIAKHPGDPVVGQARLALARLYEAREQPEQALRMYRELTRPGVQSAWSREASMRQEQLLRKHPQLAPTNAPSATLTTQVTNAPAAVPAGKK